MVKLYYKISKEEPTMMRSNILNNNIIFAIGGGQYNLITYKINNNKYKTIDKYL